MTKPLHCKLLQDLFSQGYICFTFSEKVRLRYKSSNWKSQCIQKCNGFATIGFEVFINFTEKVSPSNKLINSNTSVLICMIFTLRLSETKSVYTFYVPSPIFKDSILTKSLFSHFYLVLLTKWPQSIFLTKWVFTIALYIPTQILIQLT